MSTKKSPAAKFGHALYLALIILTYRILKQGIELLGFDCPERM